MTATVRMWEGRARPGALAELLAWLREAAGQAVLAGALSWELSAADAPDPRAVLVTRWAGEPTWAEPAAPERLVARAHAWTFRLVGSSAEPGSPGG